MELIDCLLLCRLWYFLSVGCYWIVVKAILVFLCVGSAFVYKNSGRSCRFHTRGHMSSRMRATPVSDVFKFRQFLLILPAQLL